MAYYMVDKKNQKIYANIEKMTDEEEKIVDRYRKYGYELILSKSEYKDKNKKKRTPIPHIKKADLKKYAEEHKNEELLAWFDKDKKYIHAKAEAIWRSIEYPKTKK